MTNQNQKHTPGPWVVQNLNERAPDIQYVLPEGKSRLINEIAVIYPTLDTAQANARLIAAAPELLQNLKQVVACLEYAVNVLEAPEKSSIRENLALAKQAIAKAEIVNGIITKEK